MAKDHPYCDEGRVLQTHGGNIAGLNADVRSLQQGQSKLFSTVDDLGKVATKNATLIEGIKEMLDNGITENLEKKIDFLCKQMQESKKELQDFNKAILGRVREVESKVEEDLGKMRTDVDQLKKVSWVPALLDNVSKKTFVIVVAMIIGVIAAVNTAFWAVAKSKLFQETPGLIASQSQQAQSFKLVQGKDGTFILEPVKPGKEKEGGKEQ